MVFNGVLESDFLKLVSIPLSKRPDLIDYAATDFASLRTALINYVKAVFPLDYQNFVESDLGMVFIEVLGKTLSLSIVTPGA